MVSAWVESIIPRHFGVLPTVRARLLKAVEIYYGIVVKAFWTEKVGLSMAAKRDGDFEWCIDKFLIILRAWKAIFAGSLGLVLVAAGISQAQVPVYTSNMVLPLPPGVRALIKTEAVLDPTIRGTHLAGDFSDLEVARRAISKRLVISPEMVPGSGVYSVSFTDKTPERARIVLEQMLTQIVAASRPVGAMRANVMRQIESMKGAISELKTLSRTLNDAAVSVKPGGESDSYTRAFATLVSDIEAREGKLFDLQNTLDGLRLEDVWVRPTLATSPEPDGLAKRLSIVAICSFIAMILLVLLHHELRERRPYILAKLRTSGAPSLAEN